MLTFKQLQDLVRAYTSKGGNPFYRARYGTPDNAPAHHVRSLEEWHALRPLTKQDLIATSFDERLFVPRSELQTISVTSGTTGGPPLYQPRSYQGPRLDALMTRHTDDPEARTPPDAPRAWLSGILQYPHEHERGLGEVGVEATVVQFDPQRIRESIALAKAAGVEGIVAQTYFVTAMCDAAREAGLAERIQTILAAGETWTRSEFERVQDVFKNASIICDYGTREAGLMAYTDVLHDSSSMRYRGMRHVYLEVVEPDTDRVLDLTPGVEGELLVTTTLGEPSAFPLLRYRVGDLVRVETPVDVEGNFSFTLLGRAAHDFVKLPGGQLRLDELERVMHSLRRDVSDRFEAHCHEKEAQDGPKKQIVMHVEPLRGATLDEIARDISRELHLGPSFTYDDGVQKGWYLPLSCSVLAENAGNVKRKRIVKHW